MGKASPEQMQHAMDAAATNGNIGGDAQQFAERGLGVDCIGFIMNNLISNDHYGDFGPEGLRYGDGRMRDEDYNRLLNFNVTSFADNDMTSEVENSADWRAMDVVTWTGTTENDRAGHVMMVHSAEPHETVPGVQKVVLMHSNDNGPEEVTYYHHPATGTWSLSAEGAAAERADANLIPERAIVRRADVGDDTA